MDKMSVYNHLPIVLQNAACNLQGLKINRTRYNVDFWRLLNEYESRANWSYEQLADFRDTRLRKMVKHCYETVPYYKRLFNDGGINPESIRTLDDLGVLPLLDKATVRSNPKDFLSVQPSSSKIISEHTSGSTGSSFVFKTTRIASLEQRVVWQRYWNHLGAVRGTWMAMFGNNRIVPSSQSKPPFWRVCNPTHQCYFSEFHMSKDTMGFYCDEINRRGIQWIHGYPSIVSLLASYIIDSKYKFDKPIKLVTLGAENLLEIQRKQIEQAFEVNPYQHYGSMEGVANFSENSAHVMCVDEDFAATELVCGEHGNFSVVGSTLCNYVMPLLRWKLNDLVRYEFDSDGYRVITRIDGREEDYLVLPDGRHIGRLSHIFKDTSCFSEAQIHQNRDFSIDVIIVANSTEHSADEKEVLTRLHESIGQEIPIRFKYVNEIPRRNNGKFRAVISEIS